MFLDGLICCDFLTNKWYISPQHRIPFWSVLNLKTTLIMVNMKLWTRTAGLHNHIENLSVIQIKLVGGKISSFWYDQRPDRLAHLIIVYGDPVYKIPAQIISPADETTRLEQCQIWHISAIWHTVVLTHWRRVTVMHSCIINYVIIGSDHGLAPNHFWLIVPHRYKLQWNVNRQWRKCIWKCRLQDWTAAILYRPRYVETLTRWRVREEMIDMTFHQWTLYRLFLITSTRNLSSPYLQTGVLQYSNKWAAYWCVSL